MGGEDNFKFVNLNFDKIERLINIILNLININKFIILIKFYKINYIKIF